jgi:hypothetical protein
VVELGKEIDRVGVAALGDDERRLADKRGIMDWWERGVVAGKVGSGAS